MAAHLCTISRNHSSGTRSQNRTIPRVSSRGNCRVLRLMSSAFVPFGAMGSQSRAALSLPVIGTRQSDCVAREVCVFSQPNSRMVSGLWLPLLLLSSLATRATTHTSPSLPTLSALPSSSEKRLFRQLGRHDDDDDYGAGYGGDYGGDYAGDAGEDYGGEYGEGEGDDYSESPDDEDPGALL